MILFEHVSKTYPRDTRPVVDDISLAIQPGEFVFLVGKSGAGKSTLLKMITKEEQKSSGKIIVGGIDLDYIRKRHIPHYRRRLGVVFQDFKLLPSRTVYENVAFALEIAGMSGREIRSTVPTVLELVGLLDSSHKLPRHLSGGEQQRVSIARSIARQPKILIADEPTGNLDKLTRREIIELLQKINDYGTTILVTTHDENIVNNLRKRVITLKDGKIVSDQKQQGLYTLDRLEEQLSSARPQPAKRPLNPTGAARPVILKPRSSIQVQSPNDFTSDSSPNINPASTASITPTTPPVASSLRRERWPVFGRRQSKTNARVPRKIPISYQSAVPPIKTRKIDL